MRIVVEIGLAVVFLLVLAAQSFSQERIKIAYSSADASNVVWFTALDAGLYRKHGLDVELIFLRGGQVAIQALTGGDPPLVTIGNVIIANLQGHDIVLVGSVENSYDQSVFARPGTMTRMEQLKGKRFGISGFGSATHNAALILFKKFNLEPIKDVALIPGGPDAERFAALTAGKIDATFFTSSTATPARKAGFVELLQIADLGVEVQGHGFASSRAYVQSNRDTVKSGLKGFVEAIYFIYANKKDAQKVFSKYMRTSDPAVLEDSYQGYIKMIPKKPYPTLKGIQFMLDMLAEKMPQAKNAKPEQFVDLSFLQELEKEGFFTEMAKRYPTQ